MRQPGGKVKEKHPARANQTAADDCPSHLLVV
jgi:hypothetical protein